MFWKKKVKEEVEPIEILLTVGDCWRERTVIKLKATNMKVIKNKNCYFDNKTMVYSINSNLVLAESFEILSDSV